MWNELDDDDIKQILYVQTHGQDTPERSATPFYLATAAAAMDNEVAIYFTMQWSAIAAQRRARADRRAQSQGRGEGIALFHRSSPGYGRAPARLPALA